jgi:hypothetical protein
MYIAIRATPERECQNKRANTATYNREKKKTEQIKKHRHASVVNKTVVCLPACFIVSVMFSVHCGGGAA